MNWAQKMSFSFISFWIIVIVKKDFMWNYVMNDIMFNSNKYCEAWDATGSR